MHAARSVLYDEVVACQLHGPPSKFWILGLAFVEGHQRTMVSDDGEGGASQVVVELFNCVNYSEKFTICWPQLSFSSGTGAGGIANDVSFAIFFKLFQHGSECHVRIVGVEVVGAVGVWGGQHGGGDKHVLELIKCHLALGGPLPSYVFLEELR